MEKNLMSSEKMCEFLIEQFDWVCADTNADVETQIDCAKEVIASLGFILEDLELQRDIDCVEYNQSEVIKADMMYMAEKEGAL